MTSCGKPALRRARRLRDRRYQHECSVNSVHTISTKLVQSARSPRLRRRPLLALRSRYSPAVFLVGVLARPAALLMMRPVARARLLQRSRLLRGPCNSVPDTQTLETRSAARSLAWTCVVVMCVAGMTISSPTASSTIRADEQLSSDCVLRVLRSSLEPVMGETAPSSACASPDPETCSVPLSGSSSVSVWLSDKISDAASAPPAYLPSPPPTPPPLDRCSDVIGDLPATGHPVTPASVSHAPLSATTSRSRIAPGMAGWSQWTRRRSRHTGHAKAHARFLQHLFRGYCRLRPSGWGRRGGLSGAPMPYRPVTTFRCRGGMCLAPPRRHHLILRKPVETQA